jgi:phosphatidylserine/phosphatidylglycerophosphate/cardiolipin synthase-like enzyme
MNGLSILANLGDSQLKELRHLIQGPLATTWSAHYLDGTFGKALGAVLLHALVALEADGWDRKKVLSSIDLLLEDREKKADWLSWVVTGSVSNDLPSRDTGVIFRSLVETAKSEMLLVTYALYKGKELLAPLHKKMLDDPDFKVRIIIDVSRGRGDTSLSSEIVARFKSDFIRYDWPGMPWPEVFYDPRGLESDPNRKAVVHAKCVIMDAHTAFVTSANLTEAAQEKNVEVGVLITEVVKVQQLQHYFSALILNSLERLEL